VAAEEEEEEEEEAASFEASELSRALTRPWVFRAPLRVAPCGQKESDLKKLLENKA
jgi:hypothetical protein